MCDILQKYTKKTPLFAEKAVFYQTMIYYYVKFI